MIKTVITIEYEGYVSSKDLGDLFMMASEKADFSNFIVKRPPGINKIIYSCKKEDKLIK